MTVRRHRAGEIHGRHADKGADFENALRAGQGDQPVEKAEDDRTRRHLFYRMAGRRQDVEDVLRLGGIADRSEAHTSELQSLLRTSFAVFCLKKNKQTIPYCYISKHNT